MDWKQWLQTLLVLMVLLSILEMLLPAGEMARFAKLVSGLAFMLAILQPLAGLLGQTPPTVDLGGIVPSFAQTRVQSSAEKLKLAGLSPLLSETTGDVATEIAAVLSGLATINQAKVELDWAGPGGPAIEVWLDPHTSEAAEQVRQVIAALFGSSKVAVLIRQWQD